MLRDTPRECGADALYFAGEVAFERGHRGRADGLEILDPELLAVLGMAFETAAQAQARSHVETGQAADHSDAPAEVFIAALQHRDRIATLLVDEEQLVKRAFDQKFQLLARFRHLTHPIGGRDPLRLGSKNYSPRRPRPASDCAAIKSRPFNNVRAVACAGRTRDRETPGWP